MDSSPSPSVSSSEKTCEQIHEGLFIGLFLLSILLGWGRRGSFVRSVCAFCATAVASPARAAPPRCASRSRPGRIRGEAGRQAPPQRTSEQSMRSAACAAHAAHLLGQRQPALRVVGLQRVPVDLRAGGRQGWVMDTLLCFLLYCCSRPQHPPPPLLSRPKLSLQVGYPNPTPQAHPPAPLPQPLLWSIIQNIREHQRPPHHSGCTWPWPPGVQRNLYIGFHLDY